MFIKPHKGLLLRNPLTQLLVPETGCEVPENSFWLRRLQAGDVIVTKPSKKNPKL